MKYEYENCIWCWELFIKKKHCQKYCSKKCKVQRNHKVLKSDKIKWQKKLDGDKIYAKNNKDKRNKYSREWAKKNRERSNETKYRYERKHRKKISISKGNLAKKWRKERPEVVKKMKESSLLYANFGTSKVHPVIKKMQALQELIKRNVTNHNILNLIKEGKTYETYI